MGRCRNQVDIVSTLVLQFQKDCGQALGTDFSAKSLAADFKILTICALQAAPAKKHGAASLRSAYTWFFPKM